MNILRSRFPKFRELSLVFLVAVFPIHFWLMISYLHELPAYLLRLSINEMVGILAYNQLFALIESLVITGGVLLLAVFLPWQWIREQFVVAASLIILISALWMIPVHYSEKLITLLAGNIILIIPISLLWSGLYFATIYVLIIMTRRKLGFLKGVLAFVDRISVLSAIYLFVDLISLFIIGFRLLS